MPDSTQGLSLDDIAARNPEMPDGNPSELTDVDGADIPEADESGVEQILAPDVDPEEVQA